MASRFQTNDLIGDYRVIDFIGRGGMGEVYRCHHEKLGRSAAVKILGENVVADDTYKERFFNEARLQASLHHPNIAELYDFKQIGSELLIFMEFVDGESLDGAIERREFSTEESLELFESIAETIAYVHSNGIVHRDIKSDNIKICASGKPKLLDFGIAKAPSSQSLTQVGGVIGTPNYLAPEQVEGGDASPQTDIWALGVLLYKMLTGRFPFEGERIESLVFQIAQGRYEMPETYNPAIPRTVSAIVRKCLSKEVAQRYRTAADLATDVRSALAECYGTETISASFASKQTGPYGKPWLVVALILLAGAVIATFVWALGGPKESPEVTGATNLSVRNSVSKGPPPDEENSNPAVRNVPNISTRKVRIDAVGGSAEVWRDGRKLGKTPLDLELGEKEVVSLKLRRAGYDDVDGPVSTSKKVWTFTLNKRSPN